MAWLLLDAAGADVMFAGWWLRRRANRSSGASQADGCLPYWPPFTDPTNRALPEC